MFLESIVLVLSSSLTVLLSVDTIGWIVQYLLIYTFSKWIMKPISCQCDILLRHLVITDKCLFVFSYYIVSIVMTLHWNSR